MQSDTRTLHGLLEAQAARTPEAVAVDFGGARLTYRALDEWAGRVAHHLAVEWGAGPEEVVGICLDRGPGLLAGIFGILKAGAAFLPLDPSYPRRRLRFVLEDAGARVLLTEPRLAAELAECAPPGTPVATGWLAAGEPGGRPPPRAAAPDALAYLIYTSGSTGSPKGVAVSHEGLGSRMDALAEMLEPRGGDRVLQFSSPGFDGFVFELLATLAAGGTLCMAPADALLPGAPLLETLRNGRITVAVLVSSALAALPEAELPHLRAVIVGAEPFRAATAARWARGRRVWNTYGTTETTVWSTRFAAGALPGSAGLVPIGRPIPGVETWVLDERGDPVPRGEPGTLHLGGSGVGRGYFGRPGLTAERWVPHPFTGRPGSRLYFTGDRVRERPDGELEFMGRLDEQVKLRGLRIELGEVEAALGGMDGVRDCAVVVHGDDPAEQRLVAYVALREPGCAAPERWRRELELLLPSYMVPGAFVPLAELPLGPSGKVDRRALPSPGLDRRALAAPPAAAGSPLERTLLGIWEDVLGVAPVGVRDDFFTLGGNSLLAVRIVSRVREALGVDLSARAFFDARTVAGLAETVGGREGGAGAAREPSHAPPSGVEWSAEAPLSFAQERLWFMSRLDPGRFLTIPMAVTLLGPVDAAALEAAFREILRRHQPLRTVFAAVDGQPRQRVLPVPPFRLAAEDPGPGRDGPGGVERLVDDFLRVPFDLGAGPMLRARLVRLGDGEHLLLIGIHHVAADRWSVDVLLRELGILYGDFVEGRRPTLPVLPVQYVQYAVWQRSGGEAGDPHARGAPYWREQLAGLPALALPTDHPRPPVLRYAGRVHRFEIPAATAGRLRRLAAEEGATVFMVMLALLDLWLAERTGQDDVAVGTLVAGRSHPELESLIGVFVNALVLRLDLSGKPTFRELLRRARRTTLDAFEHQEVPFQRVVSELAPPRDPGREPLFQVALVLHNTPGEPFSLAGLELEWQPIRQTVANFDLALYVREDDDGCIAVACEYGSELFEPATVERLGRELAALAGGAAAAPDRPLDLPAGPGARGSRPGSPAAGIGGAPPRGAPEPARTSLEARLAEVWEAVLGVRPGPEDNFFEAGGDSLAAVRLAARVESALGVGLPVRAVFEAQTLAALARRIEEASPPGPAGGPPPAVRPARRRAR